MKPLRTTLSLLLLSACLLLGCGAPEASASGPTVILWSMDGVRWDYPERYDLSAFQEMSTEGTRVEHLTPPFPSLTFPGHASLATGCLPWRHGIVANGFLDSGNGRRFSHEAEASWLQEPPLWVLAERAGLPTAVRAWPNSSGDWKGVRPRYHVPFAPGLPREEAVAWVLDLLSKREPDRPRLILLSTPGADHAGHAEGPDGGAVRRAMVREDNALDTLRSGIRRLRVEGGVVLLVVSDHGMAEARERIDVAGAIPKKGFFPYIAPSGPICNVYVKGEAQEREIALALERLPAKVDAYSRETIPEGLRYADNGRIGDFVLLAPPGSYFAGYGSDGGEAPARGMHGYDPDVPEMAGIFYAVGPGIGSGRLLPKAAAVDVAPTVCRILGIPPPPNTDGEAIALR
jgi:predicted AlkP superfamily pyrophosphatase or phosphodiesterase